MTDNIVVDDTRKMLRAIINGQSVLKQELLTEIRKVGKEVIEHKQETKIGFQRVNIRMDTLGKQLAYLEDDALTRDEHDKLEHRVTKLEDNFASV